LKEEVDFADADICYKDEAIDDVISLLKDGKQYEVMWKGFRKKYGEEYIIFEGGDSVKDTMDELEEKVIVR